MKMFKQIAVIALACYYQSTMTIPQEGKNTAQSTQYNDLVIRNNVSKWTIKLLHQRKPIGYALYQDNNDGSRRVMVDLDSKNLEPEIASYFEVLLQPKVDQKELTSLKKSITSLKPEELSLGKPVVNSGSMNLLSKTGNDIASIIYSDEQLQENGPIERKIRTFVTQEQYRGQGYGSYLLEQCIAKARTDHISSVIAFPSTDSLSIFKKFGFVKDPASEFMRLKLR